MAWRMAALLSVNELPPATKNLVAARAIFGEKGQGQFDAALLGLVPFFAFRHCAWHCFSAAIADLQQKGRSARQARRGLLTWSARQPGHAPKALALLAACQWCAPLSHSTASFQSKLLDCQSSTQSCRPMTLGAARVPIEEHNFDSRWFRHVPTRTTDVVAICCVGN